LAYAIETLKRLLCARLERRTVGFKS